MESSGGAFSSSIYSLCQVPFFGPDFRLVIVEITRWRLIIRLRESTLKGCINLKRYQLTFALADNSHHEPCGDLQVEHQREHSTHEAAKTASY
jgi:hypothetical protein